MNLVLSTSAQNDPKLSTFAFNPLTYNPAYAGSYNGLASVLVYSTQWVGFEGAPKTLFFSAHSILSKSQTAAGVDIMSDKIGAADESNYNGNFSYKLNITKDTKVSFGIKAGANVFSVDFRRLTIDDLNEDVVAESDMSYTSLNLGVGTYIYGESWSIGFSTPNILTTKYLDATQREIGKKSPYLYASGTYAFMIDDDIRIQPSILSRFAEGAPIESLIAINGNWQERLYVSVNFEPEVSIGGFIGIKFLDHIIAGYSYDFAVNHFGRYNGGIHTFMLSYKLEDYWSSERCSCFTF
jgi:type IX secretion system PorP/SprF family membrane protein